MLHASYQFLFALASVAPAFQLSSGLGYWLVYTKAACERITSHGIEGLKLSQPHTNTSFRCRWADLVDEVRRCTRELPSR